MVNLDDTFFTGYRQTALRPEEVLVSVLIPYTAQVWGAIRPDEKLPSFKDPLS